MAASISASAVTAAAALPRKRFDADLSSSTSFFFSNNRAGHAMASTKYSDKRSRRMSCNCLFGLGVPELVVIAGVTALVFGPKQLPEVGRSLGKTIKSFQKAAKEFETELKKDGESSVEQPTEEATTASEEEKEKKGAQI
ncbi:sec-independent protein translocase protein TATA, chloroplastic [Primulina huaijiensis]|uniref:sec-independent protein translocase protein TATA, chloroplastic n=1 Tax=Primulina huaijiensis TaxID=1492673 RepID=UPI003CC735E4